MSAYDNMTKAELIQLVKKLETEKSARGSAPDATFVPERDRLVHELHVHQVELETQNEELRQAHQLLEESRDRYADLYDFAPVGYVTLDAKGTIQEINLTGAAMLGADRAKLVGFPFSLFVAKEEIVKFHQHFWQCKQSKKIVKGEIVLASKKEAHLVAQLTSVVVHDTDKQELVLRTTIEDITERKRAEEARAEIARVLSERVKELDCLYDISKLMERANLSLSEILTQVANLMPPAWQHPVACARIVLGSQEFKTQNFKETAWRLVSPIWVHGKPEGSVEVAYLEEMPASDEGPFLKEERNLLDAVAERVGKVIERLRAEESLRASEALLRTIAENYPNSYVSIIEKDLTVGFTAGQEFKKQNLNPEQFIGLTLEQVFGDQAPVVREHYLQAFAGQAQSFELCINNQYQFYRTVPLYAPDGTVPRILSVVENITARKRAEEAQHESEMLLQAAIDILPVGLWIINADGKIVTSSAAAQRIWAGVHYVGIDQLGEYKGWRTDSGKLIDAHEWAGARALEKGETSIEEEVEIECFDGTHKIILDSAVPLRKSDGNIRGAVTINQDITKRKRAETALREQEQFLDSIIENIPDMIFVKDAQELRFVRFNLAGEKLLGYPRQALYGKNDYDFFPKEEADFFVEKDRDVLQSGQLLDIPEETVQTKDAGTRILHTKKIPLLDEQGQPRYLLGISEDITVRQHAEEKIRQQLERLSALNEINQAITSNFDLRLSLNTLLTHVLAQLKVDAATILKFDPQQNVLELAAWAGLPSRRAGRLPLWSQKDYASQAALERRLVHIPNLAHAEHALSQADALHGNKFAAYVAVPLIAKGKVKGVLEIYHRTPLDPARDWFDYLKTIAMQAAVVIDDIELFNNLQRANFELNMAYDSLIEGWSRAHDLRENSTEGHAQRITEMTLRLAQQMNLSELELVHIRRGGLLHDIGKISIPDAILLKPGALTDEEWVVMRQHPVTARDLLFQTAPLRPAIDIPYCHHEKWDGTGYPRGLKGEEIPLSARLFAVVDVWDSLGSDRPYRAAWPEEKIYEYIRAQAGIHFDPQVVKMFFQIQGRD